MVLLLMDIITCNAEETHLCNNRSLSCEKKFTIQQYGARCHRANFVTNYLNENVPDCIRKEN